MVNTPRENMEAPQKVGAIKGLTGKIVAALAALGIATSPEKVEGATILLGNGLSNSTISAPTKISGLANEASSWSGDLNSRLSNGNAVVGTDVSKSRFTVTLNATDIGVGGTLTITGKLQLSTQPTATVGGISMGVDNATYDLSQRAQWGKIGDTMTTISFIDSPRNMLNDSAEELNATESWFSGQQPFTINIPITSAGTYYLDNVLERRNVSGGAEFRDFTMSYTPIPEPSSGLIAGSLLSAALLRRRRQSGEK